MPLQTELSDKLVISGQAGLAGHLEVVLEGTLQPGTDYVIITASTVSGIFASSNAPDFGLVVVYEPTDAPHLPVLCVLARYALSHGAKLG